MSLGMNDGARIAFEGATLRVGTNLTLGHHLNWRHASFAALFALCRLSGWHLCFAKKACRAHTMLKSRSRGGAVDRDKAHSLGGQSYSLSVASVTQDS